jgi:hypothetical protein
MRMALRFGADPVPLQASGQVWAVKGGADASVPRYFPDPLRPPLVVQSHEAIATSQGENPMKTLTSILGAAAILAFAAQAGTAANVKHAKHSTTKVGYGPYAYLGNTATANQSTSRIGSGPYAYLGNTAPVG